MSKKAKSGMGRLFELASAHKGLLAVSGVMAGRAALSSFFSYIAIYFIVRDVITAYPDFSVLNVSKEMGYALWALAGIIIDVVFYFFSSICAHIAAFGTQYDLKRVFTQHLAHVPLGFHLTIGSGRFRKVIDQDVEKIERFLAHSYPDMVASYVAPFALLVVLFLFDWRFGIAALVAVIIAFVIQMMSMGVAGQEVMQEMQKTGADMTEASVEYVRGMPVLKAFGQTAHSFRQLASAVGAYTEVTLGFTLKCENYISMFRTIINNIYLVILPVGILIGQRTDNYESFLLSFIFYLLFTPAIAAVLNKYMYVSSSSMRISSGVGNYDAMMALPELKSVEGKNISPADTNIEFCGVSFSYDGTDTMALSDVSFTAPAGKITAIVGPSGGGKSTIAHLIPRFWDVTDGHITIGGIDIQEIPEEVLMQQVSFVFQDVYLFGQSIRENIRMGRPGATDAEVVEAAKAACCDEFISELPKGYDTVFGEDGVHLSGGEAQRISIARAIIKNAPILILDEATSALDSVTEAKIQHAFDLLARGRTTLIIAHRLSTIRSAHRILVVQEGRIAEQGSHEELLRKQGAYARLYHTQNLGEIPYETGEDRSDQ